jgi:hypothetical protein
MNQSICYSLEDNLLVSVSDCKSAAYLVRSWQKLQQTPCLKGSVACRGLVTAWGLHVS